MRKPVSPVVQPSRLAPMIQALERDGFEVIYLGRDQDQHGRPTTIVGGPAPPSGPAPVEEADLDSGDPIGMLTSFERSMNDSVKRVRAATEKRLVGQDVELTRRHAGTDPLSSRPDDNRDGRVERIYMGNGQFMAQVAIYKASGDGFLTDPVDVPVSVLKLKA